MEEKTKIVEMDQAMMNRSVNAGFSGGEKKRNEILQMAVLEPRLAILDETDSGLDIDALKSSFERRERTSPSGQCDDRRHSLSASAQLHRSRSRARARAGTNCEVRWQRAGARARGERLRLDSRSSCVSEVVDALIQGGIMVADGIGSEKSPKTSVEAYRWDFDKADESSREPQWLRSMRQAAMKTFESVGFPTMKNEDWHFTNVAPIAAHKFQPAKEGAAVSASALKRIEYGQNVAHSRFCERSSLHTAANTACWTYDHESRVRNQR